MGWLKGFSRSLEPEVLRVQRPGFFDFRIRERRGVRRADVLIDLRIRLRAGDRERRLGKGQDEAQRGLGHRPVWLHEERESFCDGTPARDHRRGPMMADVPRWKRRIWMDASGEEAVPQGLAGDDSDARPPSLREDLLDPFLTQQAKRDLERLRFPGLETQKRLDGLVDGNPVVVDLVLPFQCVEDLVRGRVRHQFRGRVVQLIEVHVVRAESLQGSIQGEREVARVEVHPNASAVKVSADLRRQEHLFPAAFEGLSEDFLTVAPAVHVGGVEEVDSEVNGPADRLDGFRVLRGTIRIPVRIPADRPRAEAYLGHVEARPAEWTSLHGCPNGPACKNVFAGRVSIPPDGACRDQSPLSAHEIENEFRTEGFKRSPARRGPERSTVPMHTKAILVALCLIVTGLAAVFASPSTQAATYVNDQLMEERGATAALGGGDHVFVRFGSDAAFGIVYGTTANPNNIYVVAIKARYLGVAHVVDSQGRTLLDNRAIKIYTLYAMKLDSIVEFRDNNGNGIADYARVYNGTTNRFSNYINRAGDVLYKKVDLNTNWTAGPIVRTNGTGYRTWTFDLSATNLSYSAVANYTGSVAGVLPLVHFTFHLNASAQQVTNVTVPRWNVTISGGNTITTVTRAADLLVSGKAVHYDLKWDQDIEGWTYAAGNGAGVARRLLLEIGAIVGNFIPAALADQWLENHVLGPMHESGSAQFNSTIRAETANETTGNYATARRLATPHVAFGANLTRIGRYLWVGTSTVDGNPTRPVYGEIVAGLRFAAVGENGNRFVGFVLLAGLSFRGGASVIHDPTVTTDVQADLQLPSSPAGPNGTLIALVGGIAVVAAILLIFLFVRRRRGKTSSMPPPPPPPET